MNKKFKNFNKHLYHFLGLSMLVFLAILIYNSLYVVLDDPTGIFSFVVPLFVHYLGIFISVMMMVMGVYYMRVLREKKDC